MRKKRQSNFKIKKSDIKEIKAEIYEANRALTCEDFTDIKEVCIIVPEPNEYGVIHATFQLVFKKEGQCPRVYEVRHIARAGEVDCQYRELAYPEIASRCALTLQAVLLNRFREDLGNPQFPTKVK